MRNLALPPDEFEKEINVVMEERRWRTEDKPQSFTYEVMKAAAFQTSPYRQPTIGWMNDLQNMSVDDLRQWYEHWYAPNNATLVVVGDVQADDIFELAKKHFGAVPRRDVPVLKPRPEVEQYGSKRVIVKRPAELPYLVMAYKTPTLKTALDHPEQVAEWEPYALEVMNGILDGGSSARFATNLVRGQEIAAGIGSNYQLISRLDNLLSISSVPANGHTVEELEQAVREQLEDLKTNLVSDEELQRVKTQVVADDVYQRDSIFYQGMILGIFESIGLPWQRADEYVDKVKAVTAEQVRQVAQKYLVEDGLTVAVLEPQPLDNNTTRRPPPPGVHDEIH